MPRKKIRLPSEGYQGGNAFSVTIATYYRKRIFDNASAATAGMSSLLDAARQYDASVYAYCFMPDHLHLLAQTPPGTDFSRFVNFFKQSSGLALREVIGTSDSIWQPRFYDHGLRSDEGLLAAAEYVFNNPVRGELVAEASQYPYSGSLEWPHMFQRNSSLDPAPEITSEPEGTELHAIRTARVRG